MVIPKRKTLVLALVIISVWVVALPIIHFVVQKTMVERPEMEMVENALRSNDRIVQRFGKINVLRFERKGSGVELMSDNVDGNSRFYIEGSKSNGLLEVQWKNRGSGNKNFRISRIDEINDWKDSTQIWP
jgi:hypothetical protein